MTIYEGGLHVCGHHRDIAFSDDADGYFDVVEAVCQACAAADRHAKDTHDRGERQPGRVSMIRNTQRPGERIAPWSP